jgi:hypothetical protein
MSPKEGAGYQEYCYAVLFLFRHCTMVSTTFSHVVDCVQKVNPHTAHVIHAGSMQPVADHSLAIMDALFAPFDAASFPKQLSVPQLTQLLEAPFATRVPLAPSTYQYLQHLYPDLFTPEASTSAPLLVTTLLTALQSPWPTGPPSVFLYTPFWANVGYGFPEAIGRRLGLNITECRFVSIW